jgi:hypothetical protein
MASSIPREAYDVLQQLVPDAQKRGEMLAALTPMGDYVTVALVRACVARDQDFLKLAAARLEQQEHIRTYTRGRPGKEKIATTKRLDAAVARAQTALDVSTGTYAALKLPIIVPSDQALVTHAAAHSQHHAPRGDGGFAKRRAIQAAAQLIENT